jgi:hypothetical protein
VCSWLCLLFASPYPRHGVDGIWPTQCIGEGETTGSEQRGECIVAPSLLHLLLVEEHVGDAFADGESTGTVLALEFALLHVDLSCVRATPSVQIRMFSELLTPNGYVANAAPRLCVVTRLVARGPSVMHAGSGRTPHRT